MLTTTLLAVLAVGVAAQDAASLPFSVAFVGADYPMDETTGLETFVFDTEAADARATGILTLLNARGKVLEYVGDDANHNIVQKAGAQLVNEGGTWSGTVLRVSYWDVQTDDAVNGAIYELIGDGDYDGLSMYLMSRGPDDLVGFIIPTQVVPAQPEPPSAPESLPVPEADMASGRIEMPDHRYAITFPDDWEVERLDGAEDEGSIEAFAPTDGWFIENCSVDVGGCDTRGVEDSLETVLASESWVALGDGLVDGPHGSIVSLPVGDVVRVDYTMRLSFEMRVAYFHALCMAIPALSAGNGPYDPATRRQAGTRSTRARPRTIRSGSSAAWGIPGPCVCTSGSPGAAIRRRR